MVPSAVFADPQVASVGATEQDLRADPATRLLLGAHIVGPPAATLIQTLIRAMSLGSKVDQVASGVLYIHPALTEGGRAGAA
ncbi:MAG: hypothetical protein ACYCU3_11160 [Streptosporangiaceae bacterium]